MIFYFTGTGNSLQVAKNISRYHQEKLYSIASLMHNGQNNYDFTLQENEKVGFVFPIYAWGPPKMVLDFIDKLNIVNFKDHYVFSIVTCGENIGNAMKILEKSLKKKNMDLHSGFSIAMPNNYIVMGMDVDSKEESERKLLKAEESLKTINKIIEKEEKNVFQLNKGKLARILTPLVYPMFIKHSMNTNKFYVKENCTSCGICEKVCNTKTIKMEKKPVWGNNCSQCFACINLCPVRAIEYGKGTMKKGRYKNPNIKIEELKS